MTKRPIRWKRWLLLAIGLMFVMPVIFVLFSLFWPSPAIIVSKETTYITEPLDADGQVDYLAALETMYGADLPPEENAARHYIQVIPRFIHFPDEYELAVLRLLDLPPPTGDEVALEGLEYFMMDLMDSKTELIEQTLKIHQVPGDEELADLRSQLEGEEANAIEALQYSDHEYLLANLPELPDLDSPIYHFYDMAALQPWTAAELPFVAAWLESQAIPLQHIETGTKLEKCYCPIRIDDSHFAAPVFALSDQSLGLLFAREHFRVRSMMELGSNEFAKSWKTLRTGLKLGQHLASQSGCLSVYTGRGVQRDLLEATPTMLHHADFTFEELVEIEREFEAVVPVRSVSQELKSGERLAMLWSIQRLASGRFDEGNFEARWIPGVDWNVAMRNANRYFDMTAQILEMPRNEAQSSAMTEVEAEFMRAWLEPKDPQVWIRGLFSRSQRSDTVGNYLRFALDPTMEPSYLLPWEDRYRARLDLTRIAFALAKYRAATGEYPKQLVQLVPDYMTKLPNDRFLGKPLNYRRVDEGYQLYSVGPNFQDNGGVSARLDERLDIMEFDDIAVQQPFPMPKAPWVQARELLETGYYKKLCDKAESEEIGESE